MKKGIARGIIIFGIICIALISGCIQQQGETKHYTISSDDVHIREVNWRVGQESFPCSKYYEDKEYKWNDIVVRVYRRLPTGLDVDIHEFDYPYHCDFYVDDQKMTPGEGNCCPYDLIKQTPTSVLSDVTIAAATIDEKYSVKVCCALYDGEGERISNEICDSKVLYPLC